MQRAQKHSWLQHDGQWQWQERKQSLSNYEKFSPSPAPEDALNQLKLSLKEKEEASTPESDLQGGTGTL